MVSLGKPQKSTIGVILPQSDMPFTEKGITPDLMINPNAIPSRMTIGQLLECLLGKRGAILGTECDGTAFTKIDPEKVKDELEKLGYNRDGSEYMYNGMTGHKMKSMIFIGPTYYQRLKHLTSDKIHCLSSDTDVLTSLGWKQITEISLNDEIATLKNNELVYERPINIFDYPCYAGNVYTVSNKFVDLKVTGNHRMWISKCNENGWERYNFAFAEDIVGKLGKYKKNVEWNCTKYQFVLPEHSDNGQIYCEKELQMDLWLTFFGIWLTTENIENAKNITEFSNACEILEKMEFKCSIDKDNKIKINNIQMNDYLEELKKSGQNETIPDWVWKLDQDQSMQLLNGIVHQNINSVYITHSQKFADSLMRLSLHCGLSCDIRKNNNSFEIEFNMFENEPRVNKNQIEDKIEFENCHMCCLEVPSEVFYVRRNGKGIWTGNSRSNGPRTLLVHQPSEGRARGGGMRIGEMERDALIAHGVSKYIKEKLMDTSDIYTTYVCDECGLFAQRSIKSSDIKMYPTIDDVYYCPSCDNKTHISKVVIPYAFKLLLQELMSMCIARRIRTVNNKYTH